MFMSSHLTSVILSMSFLLTLHFGLKIESFHISTLTVKETSHFQKKRLGGLLCLPIKFLVFQITQDVQDSKGVAGIVNKMPKHKTVEQQHNSRFYKIKSIQDLSGRDKMSVISHDFWSHVDLMREIRIESCHLSVILILS